MAIAPEVLKSSTKRGEKKTVAVPFAKLFRPRAEFRRPLEGERERKGTGHRPRGKRPGRLVTRLEEEEKGYANQSRKVPRG